MCTMQVTNSTNDCRCSHTKKGNSFIYYICTTQINEYKNTGFKTDPIAFLHAHFWCYWEHYFTINIISNKKNNNKLLWILKKKNLVKYSIYLWNDMLCYGSEVELQMPFCVDFHVPVMVNKYSTVQKFGVALKKEKKLILLLCSDAFNWSTVTVKTFVILKKNLFQINAVFWTFLKVFFMVSTKILSILNCENNTKCFLKSKSAY